LLRIRAVDAWLTKAADGLGVPEGLPPGDVDALLELARIAAHESGDRKNAPLVCYLAGLAAARNGMSIDELVTAVRRSTS
jgi:Domain of unknown function (DUF6457)